MENKHECVAKEQKPGDQVFIFQVLCRLLCCSVVSEGFFLLVIDMHSLPCFLPDAFLPRGAGQPRSPQPPWPRPASGSLPVSYLGAVTRGAGTVRGTGHSEPCRAWAQGFGYLGLLFLHPRSPAMCPGASDLTAQFPQPSDGEFFLEGPLQTPHRVPEQL